HDERTGFTRLGIALHGMCQFETPIARSSRARNPTCRSRSGEGTSMGVGESAVPVDAVQEGRDRLELDSQN
ncbi:hypothetical protein, partial [Acinetobacter baumannii]|uniref:hypothetical protein n=1 Tax=Acinetobacter baumannii TaxID=470 RepID=UPI001C08CA7B